jgi:Xaa-Pro aminopeptidase
MQRRFALLRSRMKSASLAGLILFSQAQPGYSGAVLYVSRYRLTTRRGYVLLPMDSEPILFVAGETQKVNARKVSFITDIRSSQKSWGILGELISAVKNLNLEKSKIGIVNMNTMPYNDLKLLSEELSTITFCDATEFFDQVRWSKSEEELELLRETAKILDGAFLKILDILKAGVDEREVVGEVVKHLVRNGVDEMIILSAKGPSFSGHLGRPEHHRFSPGEHYIFSVEAQGPSGYWSQMVRFISFGPCDEEYRDLFLAAKEVLREGVETLLPGVRIRDVVKKMVHAAHQRGLKIGEWIGHGMGVDLGDNLDVVITNENEITEGMVITLHPHVQLPKSEKGITLGDTFAVTSKGAESLSSVEIEVYTV